MAMVVKNNVPALETLNTLNKNQSRLSKSLQQVSSGMKINSAQDDASGYAISERMRVYTRSLDQASDNTQNGSSLMKTAEGAVSKTVDILRTLKEKAIAAATDTKTEADRATIQKEINQLVDQIDDNALITFNGKYLIDGSKSAAGDATYSTWTNQALAEDTTGSTKLTNMKARDGEALTIEATDHVTVSYVQNGRTYTANALVGNKSLVDVFKMAEAIDTTTTTFAISSNDAVQTAGGSKQFANDAATLSAAINTLKDKLSYVSSSKINLNGLGTSSDTSKYIEISGEGKSAKIVLQSTSGSTTSISGAILPKLASDSTITSTTALEMNTSYNGELTQKVANALEAYINASSAAGDSTTGAAKTLIDTIRIYNSTHSENAINWVYHEGALDDFEVTARNAGDSVFAAYNTLKAAVDSKAAAYTELENAVKEYNEGLAQLDALLALKALEDVKTAFRSEVVAYVTKVTNEMSSAPTGTVYTLPAGVAGNEKPIVFTKGSSDESEIDNIVSKLSDKLTGLVDDLSLMGESSTYKAFEDAVSLIVGYSSDTEVLPTGSETTAQGAAINAIAADAETTFNDLMDKVTSSNSTTTLVMAQLESYRETGSASDSSIGRYMTDLALEAVRGCASDAESDTLKLAIAEALSGFTSDASISTTSAGDSATAKETITNMFFHSNLGISVGGAYPTDADKSAAIVYDPYNLIKAAKEIDAVASAIPSTAFSEKLKLVYDDILADLSGPALLVGSDVGVDPAGKIVSTLDGSVGLSFMAAKAGTDGQISGFSISISDSEGNIRKSVNTSLNSWTNTIYAKNASEKDNSLVFHIGASANQAITVDMADMRAEALGLKGKDGKVVDVSTKDHANAAISVFENALQKALDVQTTIGAIEARLTYTNDNLITASENLTAAESTIRDADMAKAMTEYTKNNVLLQAAQSMLAQANQNSSAVLSLLQ